MTDLVPRPDPSTDLTVVERREAWERQVRAWPTAFPGADGNGPDINAVQERVLDALTVELSTLQVGERLRFESAFGGATCESVIYRIGPFQVHEATSQLGSVVGLDAWRRVGAPLPPVGGPLVGRVLPIEPISRVVVPWSRLLAVVPTDGHVAELTVWSRLVERLAHNRLPVAVVVEVERRGLPSRAQDVVVAGLEARAQERARDRSFQSGRATVGIPDRPRLVGDYAISIGLVGDIDTFVSNWRSETGFSLQSGTGLARRSFANDVVDLLTAPQAAQLLPLPVLPEHSVVPVARFRPRASTVTRPVSPERGVTVARTDGGVRIGFEADSVNRHLLVVGETGTGKSITTMSILADLWNDFGIPWLVLDPLKYEYARLRVAAAPGGGAARVPVRHLRLGQVPVNPLVVPDSVDPLAMASAMAQAFSSTSALGEAFPLGDQIARTAFNDLYAGDAHRSGRGNGSRGPTFADLEAALMAATYQEGLSGETVNNIRASLLGRLRAITSGVAGDVFAGGPRAGIDWAELSRFPTVITFPPGIGQQERSIIYALLVAAHWSWRLANPVTGRHLIVLEEVHQVYGRSNPVAAAVLDSLLSTMRASGQGYLAVTQTPHQLEEQTQRSFQNIVAHRTRHHAGLQIFQAFGHAASELDDLDDGEVIALLQEPGGVRGRVPDRSDGAGRVNPMTPVDSHRASEFTLRGPSVRGWCSACPAPCRGRSWLGYATDAATVADQALASGADTRTVVTRAVEAVLRSTTATVGAPVHNPAGLYCAAARGVTVALGVRGAGDAEARAACAAVRQAISIGGTT